MRYSELKTKEVINVKDGRRLGVVTDLEFTVQDGRIQAIIVPAQTKWTDILRGHKGEFVIPWNCIQRIGDDVILVQVDDTFLQLPDS